MNWKEWIKLKGVSETADALGVTRSTIYLWLDDITRPKDDHKKALVQMAGGLITYDSFFNDGPEGAEGKEAANA